MPGPRRVNRVAERIRDIIAVELLRVADPRFAMATITSVVVSRDLGHAKIYWMISGSKDRIPETQKAFDAAAPMFRRVVGDQLEIRFVPQLRFYYDDTLDTRERVDELLRQVAKTLKPVEDLGEAPTTKTHESDADEQ